jgi:ribosomal-protein-alanine N-acetyltransferase
MAEPLTITGPTLTLRFARESDAAGLFQIGSDVETTKYLSWGPYAEVGQAEHFIAGMPGQIEYGEELGFLVTRGDEILGVTAFTEPRPRDRSVIIGTWLHRDHWGTGVNTESKALMAALAFNAMGVERLGVYAAVTNERSRRALKKVGFTEEGVLRHFHLHGDKWYDLMVGSILREEYPAGPLADVPVVISGEVPANWAFA